MVRFAARCEMERDGEDVLARRCRLLFLDAAEAARQTDGVAAHPGRGTGRDMPTAAFKALAAQY